METKKCPYCCETIKAEAVKCRYCGEFIESKTTSEQQQEKPQEQPPVTKPNYTPKYAYNGPTNNYPWATAACWILIIELIAKVLLFLIYKREILANFMIYTSSSWLLIDNIVDTILFCIALIGLRNFCRDRDIKKIPVTTFIYLTALWGLITPFNYLINKLNLGTDVFNFIYLLYFFPLVIISLVVCFLIGIRLCKNKIATSLGISFILIPTTAFILCPLTIILLLNGINIETLTPILVLIVGALSIGFQSALLDVITRPDSKQ